MTDARREMTRQIGYPDGYTEQAIARVPVTVPYSHCSRCGVALQHPCHAWGLLGIPGIHHLCTDCYTSLIDWRNAAQPEKWRAAES